MADRGPWIQTYTGRAFPLFDATPEDINPTDIAHSLGMQCRYNGHVHTFYSVAEHCVLMSHAVSPENALWALLHDATEAYVGDMVAPLKRTMPDFKAAEDRIMAAICERYGLAPEMPAEVKAADRRILHDERWQALGPTPRPWMPELEALEPLGVRLSFWAPETASGLYRRRLEVLTDA